MAADPVIPEPLLNLTTTRSSDQVAIACTGRITAETVDLLASEVRAALAQSSTVIVDMTAVSYLDSSGLGALVGLYSSAKESGKALKLVKFSDRVAELLRLTRLAGVFDGYGA